MATHIKNEKKSALIKKAWIAFDSRGCYSAWSKLAQSLAKK